MAHWLLKSEPTSYGWEDLVRDGRTEWDGVRNHAAAAHLRQMAVGDTAFLYHSGDKAAVGIAHVTRAARPDGEDGAWTSVEIAPDRPLRRPVTLAEMKAAPALGDMVVLRQPRLSVSPVTAGQWAAIKHLAAT